MADAIQDHLDDLKRSRYSRAALNARERLLRSIPVSGEGPSAVRAETLNTPRVNTHRADY